MERSLPALRACPDAVHPMHRTTRPGSPGRDDGGELHQTLAWRRRLVIPCRELIRRTVSHEKAAADWVVVALDDPLDFGSDSVSVSRTLALVGSREAGALPAPIPIARTVSRETVVGSGAQASAARLPGDDHAARARAKDRFT